MAGRRRAQRMQAGGPHPTGMRSCFFVVFFCKMMFSFKSSKRL